MTMARYSKRASAKVGRVMSEYKHGKLRSSSGRKVRSRKQAIAIGLSEARARGYKVPRYCKHCKGPHRLRHGKAKR
jgi:hypothetical protein